MEVASLPLYKGTTWNIHGRREEQTQTDGLGDRLDMPAEFVKEMSSSLWAVYGL